MLNKDECNCIRRNHIIQTCPQQPIRKQLREIFYKDPKSIEKLASELFIGQATLRKFLLYRQDLEFSLFYRILVYVEEKLQSGPKSIPKNIDKKRENE